MNSKHLVATASIVMALFGVLLTSSPAVAASQDECAIWLCLPGGFPSGCGAAHSAMVSRIQDGKSPLPAFSACSVTPPGGSQMTSSYGPAAFIPERKTCTRGEWFGNERYECTSWQTTPARYVKGQSCRASNSDSGAMIPAGCTSTSRFVEVYADGVQQGPTYWW